MPRRKIVGGPEEIEYRLLNIVRWTGRLNGAQALAALASLAALAHLYKVELGSVFEALVRRALTNVTPLPAPTTEPLSGDAGPAPAQVKEPLTTPSLPGMFDDLEDNDE
jgi:hypothetical protein